MTKFKIIEGDCLDTLAGFAPDSIDALVTDPPFAFAGGASNGRKGANLTNMVDGGIGGNTTPVFSKEEKQR